MPISSYLAQTDPGRERALRRRLAALPGCQVHGGERPGVLVLVTDTPSDTAEAELQDSLRGLEGLHTLALVFCHAETDSLAENES